jgi:hypothetical protein
LGVAGPSTLRPGGVTCKRLLQLFRSAVPTSHSFIHSRCSVCVMEGIMGRKR